MSIQSLQILFCSAFSERMYKYFCIYKQSGCNKLHMDLNCQTVICCQIDIWILWNSFRHTMCAFWCYTFYSDFILTVRYRTVIFQRIQRWYLSPRCKVVYDRHFQLTISLRTGVRLKFYSSTLCQCKGVASTLTLLSLSNHHLRQHV